eukprot:gene11703-biopygen11972
MDSGGRASFFPDFFLYRLSYSFIAHWTQSMSFTLSLRSFEATRRAVASSSCSSGTQILATLLPPTTKGAGAEGRPGAARTGDGVERMWTRRGDSGRLCNGYGPDAVGCSSA